MYRPVHTADTEPMTTTRPVTTISALSFDQARWLRYAAHEHRSLQAGRQYVEQTMPTRTRDALIRRGLMARHTIEGIGGGFTYFRITDAGLALVPEVTR